MWGSTGMKKKLIDKIKIQNFKFSIQILTSQNPILNSDQWIIINNDNSQCVWKSWKTFVMIFIMCIKIFYGDP